MTFTNDLSMTHVPMCHTCGTAEVAGAFTDDMGEGFCSASCEAEAQAEFASWQDEPFGPMSERFADYDYERKLAGDMAEPFDRDVRDDEAALESVYGPEDDSGYDSFNDWG